MIYDIDRTNDDRTKPTPNTQDKVISPMSMQTISTQYNPVGENTSARVQMVGKTIVANNGVDNVASFGYNPALNDWGLFVAQNGIDVMSNTDLSKLVFNSNQNTFKIVERGIVTMPTYPIVSAAGAWRSSSVAIPPSVSIAHGQGRIPLVFAFLKVTGAGGPTLLTLPQTSSGLSGGNPYFYEIGIAVNDTYIEITESYLTNGVVALTTGGGGTVEYYVLQETST